MTQLQKDIIKKPTYPESDGKPMAENTVQYRNIVTTKEGIENVFRHRPDVFIAADLLWYPVEGNEDLRVAPDVLVVLGRPKRDRRRYLQWEEDNIAPQVVFEIWSPGNRNKEKRNKLEFYQKYGAQEYYTYDPDRGLLEGWRRQPTSSGSQLLPVPKMQDWTSPLLKIKFELVGKSMELYGPDGKRFLSFPEVLELAAKEQQRADHAWERAEQAEVASRAEQQRAERAEQEITRLKELLRQANLPSE